MISPKKALIRLKEGNERFWKGKSTHPNRDAELRSELLNEQKPFAVVIACSDSRVPVEIILDVGLGDLFVIRTAGQVLSREVLGSMEYAVKKLKVKLVVILGHDNCGAVKSALAIYKSHKYDKLSDNLQTLLNHFFPVFEKMENLHHNTLNEAIIENINYQIEDLKQKDAYLAAKIKKKEIMLVGAKYNLSTGKIDFYDNEEDAQSK